MSLQSFGLYFPPAEPDDEYDEPSPLTQAWCTRVAKVCISDRMTNADEERLHGVWIGAEAMRDAILANPSYYGLQEASDGD